MKTFKELIEKSKVVSTLDLPGALASYIDKKFGKRVKILDTGKEYKITIVKGKLDDKDIKALVLSGLNSIDGESMVITIGK